MAQMRYSVGQVIKELRQQKGWSRQRLADVSGVSYGFIKALEQNPELGISVRIASKLAQALDTPPDIFFKEVPPLPRPFDAILAELEASQPIAIPLSDPLHFAAGDGVVEDYAYWARPKASNRNIRGIIARGNCLAPEIKEGEIVFVDTDLPPESGDIVIASIGDRVMAKRYRENSNGVWLESNDERINAGECIIHGVVIAVERRLR